MLCFISLQWQDVLVVIAKALDENGVKYRHITGSKHFQVSKQYKLESHFHILKSGFLLATFLSCVFNCDDLLRIYYN